MISNLTARVLKYRQHIIKEENMAVKLQPLADRVVVKPIAREEVTKSGIVLPDTAKEKPQEGQIIAVGSGKIDETGKRIPMDVKVGDVVIYARYGGTEMKIDGEELVILREGDILAKKTK
jgi:chaperonin GroES